MEATDEDKPICEKAAIVYAGVGCEVSDECSEEVNIIILYQR